MTHRVNVKIAAASLASLKRNLGLQTLALSDDRSCGIAEAIDAVLEASLEHPLHQEMRELLAFLSDWSEAHEARHLPRIHSSQAEVLRHLMEANGLRQMDLAEDLGGQSVVSEVLNGHRELNARQISRLSRRFALPADVFYCAATPNLGVKDREEPEDDDGWTSTSDLPGSVVLVEIGWPHQPIGGPASGAAIVASDRDLLSGTGWSAGAISPTYCDLSDQDDTGSIRSITAGRGYSVGYARGVN